MKETGFQIEYFIYLNKQYYNYNYILAKTQPNKNNFLNMKIKCHYNYT